jgi:hypothetical protein
MIAGKPVARGALLALTSLAGGALIAKALVPSHLGAGSERFSVVSIFDGTTFRPSPGILAGGRITSVFGGTSLDLRRTQLPETGAEIRVFTMFGGTDITVPDGWDVEVSGISVGAGVRVSTEPRPESSRTLGIRGTTLFGGLSVIPRPVLRAAEM